MAPPTVHLHASDLGKRFGRTLLFRGLSLAVDGGRSLAITGPNGSGKSTLVLILAGLLTPDRGAVRLECNGTVVASADRPMQVGLVAPYLNVYDTLSARENLLFLARTRRLRDARSRCDAMLERVGLGHRADDFVGRYSSGMKQRVKYAAALLADPPVLLLDEPSTNLDAAGIQLVEHLSAAHLARGGVLIVATNVPAEAEACDAQLNVSDFP